MRSSKQVKDGVIPLLEPQNLEEMKLHYEHEEKTVWRKDMVITCATCAALVVSALGGAIALCLIVYYKDRDMLAIVASIISGILAFVGAKFC
jgi:hypothetical protein